MRAVEPLDNCVIVLLQDTPHLTATLSTVQYGQQQMRMDGTKIVF
jgi:hypothetical protein